VNHPLESRATGNAIPAVPDPWDYIRRTRRQYFIWGFSPIVFVVVDVISTRLPEPIGSTLSSALICAAFLSILMGMFKVWGLLARLRDLVCPACGYKFYGILGLFFSFLGPYRMKCFYCGVKIGASLTEIHETSAGGF